MKLVLEDLKSGKNIHALVWYMNDVSIKLLQKKKPKMYMVDSPVALFPSINSAIYAQKG